MAEVIARLFVPGRSRTKGSLKPVLVRSGTGKVRASLRDSSELATAWKSTMVKALRKVLGIKIGRVTIEGKPKLARVDAKPYAGDVEIHLFYRFARHIGVSGEVIPSHDTPWPTAGGDQEIGDEDKLRRNVLDALTQAGVLADDRLSIGGVNLKRWCRDGEEPGVEILVRPAGAWAVHIESIMLERAQEPGWPEPDWAKLHAWLMSDG